MIAILLCLIYVFNELGAQFLGMRPANIDACLFAAIAAMTLDMRRKESGVTRMTFKEYGKLATSPNFAVYLFRRTAKHVGDYIIGTVLLLTCWIWIPAMILLEAYMRYREERERQ